MTPESDASVPSVFVMPLVLALVAVALFIALLTSQLTLILLCISVLTMTALAKGWSRTSLFRLSHASEPDRVRLFPGEQLALRVHVENAKPLPIWVQVSAVLAPGLHHGTAASLRKDVGLAPYRTARFTWSVCARRRGVHLLGPFQLKAGDPLGFFTSTRQAESHEVIVYPRLIALRPLALPRREFFGRTGVYSPVDDPSYVHGIREYQLGRPARSIHWKASARQARLVEKVREPTARERVLLLIRTAGFDAIESADSFERSLEAAASLAVQLDRSRYPVGLVTDGRLRGSDMRALPIARSASQLATLLEMLARLEPAPVVDPLEALQRSGALSWAVTLVEFCYADDAPGTALQRYLRRRNIPRVRVLCQPGVDRETQRGVYRLEDILDE